MSEQLNVKRTCHFCGTPLEGIMLTQEASINLAAQIAVHAGDALKEEARQKPIGYMCAQCGTCFCMEHFGQFKQHWLHGLTKTACPQCGQPLKDFLIIKATPSAMILGRPAAQPRPLGG